MTSKSAVSFEGCLYTAVWNAAYVHVLWRTSVLSRKLKRHHYCLEYLNETSCEVCIDHRCSAFVKHTIKFLSCRPLSLTYVISLNCHWSIIFWSMTVCWMLDQLSFRYRLNSSTYRIKFQQISFYITAEIL